MDKILKRPKPSDSERDILQFQNEYLSEKRQNTSFQPSAKCVRIGESSETSKKQSVFAKSRNKELQQKDSDADNKKNPIVMGDIVERHPEGFPGEESHEKMGEESFPKAEKIDIATVSRGKSIFAKLQEEKSKKVATEVSLMEDPPPSFGEKSFILTGAESSAIHEENLKVLSQMSEDEIKMEREKLMKSLDPKLLTFIRSKRQAPQAMEVEEITEVTSDSNTDLPQLNILQSEERKNWLHFDKFEQDKFQWMSDVSKNIPKLKPGQSFEARFDWKGILLPYVEKEEKTDNRELYLHGDDPHRPGYTIQDLFRLARSNVIQQRIQALNAIAGILRIYNQGFYDEISEFPIAKIFFLLRFALDDSTIAVAEAAANGLSALFYNEIDELLLDTLFDTQSGLMQPLFKGTESEDLAQNFSKLKIDNTELDEEMSNIEQMTDFHLAEVDLLKCLMRTNILKRIHFVTANEPISDAGSISLARILIRICREGKEYAQEVAKYEELLACLTKRHLLLVNNLPANSGKVQATILKLLRIMVATTNSWTILLSHKILPILEEYCYTRKDLTADFIHLQVECYRLLRVWLSFDPPEPKLSDFLPALQMTLEWHYQFLPIANGSQILRQHAAALVSLLNHRSFDWRSSSCSATLILCFKKWTTLFVQKKIHDFSHNILLSCCFDFISRHPHQAVEEFVVEYFQNFLDGEKFSILWQDLTTTSPLILDRRDRSGISEALPNLGGVALAKNSDEPQLQLPFNYPGTLLLSSLEICVACVRVFGLKLNFHAQVERYFKAFLEASGDSSAWFRQQEIKLLLLLIQMDICDKELTIRTALKVIGQLKGEENIGHVKRLLSIIFNVSFYRTSFTQNDLNCWSSTYWKFYSMNFGNAEISTKPCLSTGNWSTDLLPKNWPLDLLTIFLEQHISEKMQLTINPQIQDEIVTASMGFLRLLEDSALLPVTPSEEFMYLMMPFLSTECRFMEPEIKDLLSSRISSLFTRCQIFDFTLKIQGKHDFESVYIIFLNQFQSSSYGDDLFSAMVMVPLAQKYDCKWRKMIWSEHIAVLRFVTCSEDQLCGGSISPYLEPPERDTSLLRLYSQALNSNCLRKNSIPYKIAQHHVECARSEKNSPTTSSGN